MLSSLSLIPSYLLFSSELITLQLELQSLLPGQDSAQWEHPLWMGSSWVRDQRDVTTGRAVGLGHLIPFPGHTFSSNQRSLHIPPSSATSSPIQTSLPHCSVVPHTQTPIFSHLLQLPKSLQYPNISSPFTGQFFLLSSLSLFHFSLLVSSLSKTIYIGKNISAAK